MEWQRRIIYGAMWAAMITPMVFLVNVIMLTDLIRSGHPAMTKTTIIAGPLGPLDRDPDDCVWPHPACHDDVGGRCAPQTTQKSGQ